GPRACCGRAGRPVVQRSTWRPASKPGVPRARATRTLRAMRLLAGTSGFSYPEWRGSFYPPDLSPKQMLAAYAARLPTVEINNTFYRMPSASLLDGWARQVPESFTFALKAPRRITHLAKLAGVEEPLRVFFELAARLGPRLGPVLFQLPPTFKKDL